MTTILILSIGLALCVAYIYFSAGRWTDNPTPEKNRMPGEDSAYFVIHFGFESYAFTVEQMLEAKKRAQRLKL